MTDISVVLIAVFDAMHEMHKETKSTPVYTLLFTLFQWSSVKHKFLLANFHHMMMRFKLQWGPQ